MSTVTTTGYLHTQGNSNGNASGVLVGEPSLGNTVPTQLQTSKRCCETKNTGCRGDPNYVKYVKHRAYNTRIMRERLLNYTVCSSTKPGGGEICHYHTTRTYNTKNTKIGVPDPYGLTKKEVGLDNRELKDKIDTSADGYNIPVLNSVVPCGGNCDRRFCTTNPNLEQVNRYRAYDSKIAREITDNLYCKGSTTISQKYGGCPIFLSILSMSPSVISEKPNTETVVHIYTNKWFKKRTITGSLINKSNPELVDMVKITDVKNKNLTHPGLTEVTFKTGNRLAYSTYEVTLSCGNLILMFDMDVNFL